MSSGRRGDGVLAGEAREIQMKRREEHCGQEAGGQRTQEPFADPVKKSAKKEFLADGRDDDAGDKNHGHRPMVAMERDVAECGFRIEAADGRR